MSRAFVESLRGLWTEQGLDAIVNLVRGKPHHDWVLYACARALGWEWTILQQPLVNYRQHDRNAFGVNRGVDAFRARLDELRMGSFQKRQGELVAYLSTLRSDPFVDSWLSMMGAGGLLVRVQQAVWLAKGRRKRLEGVLLGFTALLGLWVT
jgi:rhamnosyltransferase